MPALPAFRHYLICQDREGVTVELWRGGEEVACLAFDTKRQVLVELHVAVGPPENQRDLRSFQSLLQLAAPLRHRNLLAVIEGGEDDGANFHVTDFLDGERLDSWLARVGPVPSWLALLVLRQLVEGLAALAGHPRLLAGVEVFHAGLLLAGERVDDILVKVCDLGLSGSKPVSTEPQFVEARAIQECGRLLLFMLTGAIPDGAVNAETLSGSHAAPELGFLLATIFQADAPHHPRTLEQLRNLVERCLHDLPPDLPARPDKLPAALRPALPLATHLPDSAAVAEEVGEECSIDTRPADSAQPYRHRGTERATRHPATVQILPPPGLVPEEFYVPLIDQAWAARGGAETPHLLKPRWWHPAASTPLLVEELPGRWTLESLVKIRQRLEPEEVLLVLEQIHAAAESAASLDLPLHWRSPQLLPVQFLTPGAEESLAASGKLSRLPLTEWPPFRIKARTWPLMLNFTQPERFQLDRLMPREPGLPADPPPIRTGILTPPTAREFAQLAVWMFGGTAHLRDGVKPLLYEALSARASSMESRADFLKRFRQRVEMSGGPPPAAAPDVSLSVSDSTIVSDSRESIPDASDGNTVPRSEARSGISDSPDQQHFPRPKPVTRSRPPLTAVPSNRAARRAAAAAAAVSNGQVATVERIRENGREITRDPAPALFSQALIVDNPEEQENGPAMGFAEALFGNAPPQPDSHPLFGGSPEFHHPHGEEEIPDGAPLGFMEAAGQHAPSWEDVAPPPRRSAWMLLLVVILISLALAALMAQLSGRAFWQR